MAARQQGGVSGSALSLLAVVRTGERDALAKYLEGEGTALKESTDFDVGLRSLAT